jgi:hypothetical protein
MLAQQDPQVLRVQLGLKVFKVSLGLLVPKVLKELKVFKETQVRLELLEQQV